MGDKRDPDTDQPLPVPGGRPVGEDLKNMIDARIALGIKKYGQPLKTHDGRDTYRDGYEESMDLNMYQHKLIMELQERIFYLESTPADQQIEDLRKKVTELTASLESSKENVRVWKESCKYHQEQASALATKIGELRARGIIVG